jgi:hypothetical protein
MPPVEQSVLFGLLITDVSQCYLSLILSNQSSPGNQPPWQQDQETAMSIRPVRQEISAVPHLEGAGVHLRRAFGFDDPALTDPFLLFDDFRNDRPEDYLKPGSPGTRTAGSRPSPMCLPAPSSMATASATPARSAPATCNG